MPPSEVERALRMAAALLVPGQVREHPHSTAMTRDELLTRISIDPTICFGRPCIRGHRIWVSLVLDFLASGMSVQDVMAEYGIEEVDVLACIAYGAEMARFVDESGLRDSRSQRPASAR